MNKSRLYSSFGKRLKELRLSKGITPSQFSHLTGIDEDTLHQYENGDLEPKLSTIMVMANALKVSHLELMDMDLGSSDPD
jgi:transcriptional regulator with XRE-family HTH domain